MNPVLVDDGKSKGKGFQQGQEAFQDHRCRSGFIQDYRDGKAQA